MAVPSLSGAARIATASDHWDLATAIRATDRPGHSTKPAEGDPGSVVEVDVVGRTEVVGGVEVVGGLVVVAVGLQTAGLASQSDCTSREQDFRQRARCLPLSPEHSESMQAAISSRHAFLPQIGGFARAGNARSSIATIAAPTDIVNERVVIENLPYWTHWRSLLRVHRELPAREIGESCVQQWGTASFTAPFGAERPFRNTARRVIPHRARLYPSGADSDPPPNRASGRASPSHPRMRVSSDPRYSTTQVSPLCSSARRSPFDFFLAAATCAPRTSS
jgi:hypothetical protein